MAYNHYIYRDSIKPHCGIRHHYNKPLHGCIMIIAKNVHDSGLVTHES